MSLDWKSSLEKVLRGAFKNMVVPKVPMKTEPLNNRRVQGGSHIPAVGFSIRARRQAEPAQ